MSLSAFWDRLKPGSRSRLILYSFTSALCRELDQEGRQRIVEMLWDIVLADGVLHEYKLISFRGGRSFLGFQHGIE